MTNFNTLYKSYLNSIINEQTEQTGTYTQRIKQMFHKCFKNGYYLCGKEGTEEEVENLWEQAWSNSKDEIQEFVFGEYTQQEIQNLSQEDLEAIVTEAIYQNRELVYDLTQEEYEASSEEDI